MWKSGDGRLPGIPAEDPKDGVKLNPTHPIGKDAAETPKLQGTHYTTGRLEHLPWFPHKRIAFVGGGLVDGEVLVCVGKLAPDHSISRPHNVFLVPQVSRLWWTNEPSETFCHGTKVFPGSVRPESIPVTRPGRVQSLPRGSCGRVITPRV